jgi:hypothetical protein
MYPPAGRDESVGCWWPKNATRTRLAGVSGINQHGAGNA